MRIPIPRFIVNALIRYAKARPYFDLTRGDGTPYMGRWWLMPRCLLAWAPPEGEQPAHLKPRSWVPVSVRLHHIRGSDEDRHLHDHPFDNWSLVLEGGYWEVIPKTIDPSFLRVPDGGVHERTDYVWRAPGAFIRRRASDRHRIKLATELGAWSIFVQFGKVQPWGFYTPHGKVYWWNYNRVRDPVDAAKLSRAEDAMLARARFSAISGGNRG